LAGSAEVEAGLEFWGPDWGLCDFAQIEQSASAIVAATRLVEDILRSLFLYCFGCFRFDLAFSERKAVRSVSAVHIDSIRTP
jgi:hypothetical protein